MLVKPNSAGEVKVRIYDMQGALVREMTAQYKGTGMEVLQWNGTDSSGKQVPPGLYPVFVEAPGIKYRDKLAVAR